MADLSIQISPAEAVKIKDGNQGTTGDQGIIQLFGVLHVQDTVTAQIVLPALTPSPQPSEAIKVADSFPAAPQLDTLQPAVLTENIKVSDQFLSNNLSATLTETLRLSDLVYGAARIAGDLSAGLLDTVRLKDGNQAIVGEQGITQLLGVVHVVDGPPQLRFNPDSIGLTTESLKVQDQAPIASLEATGDLGPSVLTENIKISDGPPLAATDILSVSATETVKVADTPAAQLTPLQTTAALTEALRVADGPSLQQLTPLQTAALVESIKVSDGPLLVTGPTITIPVTDPAFFCAPFTTYSNGGGAITATNVKGSSTYVLSNDPGWYFKTVFSGTSVSLLVDASFLLNNSDVTIGYSIDGGAVTKYDVQITDTTLSLATSLADTTHTLRVDFVKTDHANAVDRWNTPVNALKITGLVIDSGRALSAPTVNTPTMLLYGDSVMEGRGIEVAYDAAKSFGPLVANAWQAEYGQIGFSAQGIQQGGFGNVPVAPSSWDLYYASHSRLVSGAFSPAPRIILLCWGLNLPSSGDDTLLAGIIANMRAAAPSAYIAVCVPWNGSDAAQLASAVSIAADPKVLLINTGTTSYGNTDGTHLTVQGDIDYARDLLARLPLGPNDLDILTDSLKASDSTTVARTPLTPAANPNEALKVQDTITANMELAPVSLTDSLKVADTLTAQLTVLEPTAALTETLRLADTLPAQPQLNPLQVGVVDEVVHVVDITILAPAILASAIESLKVQDTLSVQLDTLQPVLTGEALRITDTVSAQLAGLQALLSESVKVSDTVQGVPQLNPLQVAVQPESIRVIDDLTLTPPVTSSLSESLHVTDAITVALTDRPSVQAFITYKTPVTFITSGMT